MNNLSEKQPDSKLAQLQTNLLKNNIRPNIKRGQNFLIDSNLLHYIINLAEIKENDIFLEVGPGTGLLTAELLKNNNKTLAVELDKGLYKLLCKKFVGADNLHLLHADILGSKSTINPIVLDNIKKITGSYKNHSLKCVSNLPYSVGTPFIMNLLSSSLGWHSGVFLLQYEVARRIVAQPGESYYGSISIQMHLAAEAKICRTVPPQVFWPQPNVDSALISVCFNPVELRLQLPWVELRIVIMSIFSQRRKNLRNALKKLLRQEYLDKLWDTTDILPDCRGETLSPAQFLTIANLYKEDLESANKI